MTFVLQYSSDEPFKVFKQVAHAQELVKKLNGDLPKSAGEQGHCMVPVHLGCDVGVCIT